MSMRESHRPTSIDGGGLFAEYVQRNVHECVLVVPFQGSNFMTKRERGTV